MATLPRKRGILASRTFLIFSFLLLFSLGVLQWSFVSFGQPTKSRNLPTIWVVSNRRSGTHLSMDLLAEILPEPFRIVKTNHVYLTDDDTARETVDGLNCRCLNYMRRKGKIIHAHRDVRDVVTSSYYYYASFGSVHVKGVNKTDFFQNSNGVRDKIIQSWVNTTAPFFAQKDILQLGFSDSLSGFGHVQDRILSFLGYPLEKAVLLDPTKMKSPSHAVARRAGKGDHGYKVDLPGEVADEILRTARRMGHEKRMTMESCGMGTNGILMKLGWVRDGLSEGFWVGGDREYGLWVPSYCPPTFNGSRVVIREVEAAEDDQQVE